MTTGPVLTPLALTLKVALLATLGALAVGVPAAYALSRRSFPGRVVEQLEMVTETKGNGVCRK